MKTNPENDSLMTVQDTVRTASSAAPERLDINADVYGRSMPLWHYRELPPGMVRAEVKDLWRGRCVLYRVELGPDEGDWYSDYVRESTYRPLARMIREGKEVWIR